MTADHQAQGSQRGLRVRVRLGGARSRETVKTDLSLLCEAVVGQPFGDTVR